MTEEAVPVDTTPYAAQYELLRSRVIGEQSQAMWPDAGCQPRGVGLALLLREGMPGWLAAVKAAIGASPARTLIAAGSVPSQPPPADYTCAPPWLSGVPRHDLTTLLASLVLSTRPLERSPTQGDQSWQ